MTKENEKKLLYLIGSVSIANTEFLEEYGCKPVECDKVYEGYEDNDGVPDEVVEKYEDMFSKEFTEKLSKLLEKDQDYIFFRKLIYGMDF